MSKEQNVRQHLRTGESLIMKLYETLLIALIFHLIIWLAEKVQFSNGKTSGNINISAC